MMKIQLVLTIVTFASLIAATACENLFEALLQRRAKPIRWKWKNDLKNLVKTPEIQRQRRFLPEPSMEKWWRTMAPPKIVKSDAQTTRENLEETVFRKPFFTTVSRTEHLTEKDGRENQNTAFVNDTQSFEEESEQEKELPLNVFQSFSLPVDPFDKDNHVIIVTDYLSPTERTYFDEQNYPDAFEDFRIIPQQKEIVNEDYDTKDSEDTSPTPVQHDTDSEFLREAIIHEHHKPSKFEIHSASQRLKDSRKDFENDMRTISSVEYIVPSVEHVVSEVEYADNISISEENRISDVLPSVEYVTPTVDFVEPEVDYIIQEFNSSDANNEDYIEKEDEWGNVENPHEETFSDENKFAQENFGDKGIETDNNDSSFQIVALRRQQIRIRRNHKRHNDHFGVPEFDYPTLEALPVVQFYCSDYMPGYYVDITTRCQVFHLCHDDGQRSSFLCPVGTIFNQKYLVCDWWYNVDCDSSSKYINSETLQAYSTTYERQKITTNIDPTKQVSISTKQENKSTNQGRLQSKELYDSGRNKKQNEKENYERKKIPNLSQKAVNYPIGYAILLREYMKNNAVSDKNNRDQNTFHRNDKDGSRNAEFKFEKVLTTYQNSKTEENKTPEKTYSKVVLYPTKRNPINVEGSPKLYINISQGHKHNKNQEQNNQHKTENKYSSYVGKSHILFLNVNADKSKNILRTSTQEKPDLKNKESLVKKEKTNKDTDSILKKEDLPRVQGNTHINSKHLFKSTKDVSKYHFIIDPKEAIRPATGKQFSNGSAIKFRHAESTLKHIKPSSFINTRNNSQIFIKPEEFSRDEYSSPTDFFDDHLILNSAPRVLKTLNLNIQYGDRLSKHTRSISIFDNKMNPSIQQGEIKNYFSRHKLQMTSNKSKQVKRENTNAPELQQSESRFDFPNYDNYSVTLLNNSKKQIFELENTTVFPYIKNDNLQKQNSSNETNQMKKENNTNISELKESGNRFPFYYLNNYPGMLLNKSNKQDLESKNVTVFSYIKNDEMQKQMNSNKTNQMKKENNASEIQKSINRFHFPSFNNYSRTPLNNSKEQNSESGNNTVFSYVEKDVDDSLIKKQITISVSVETKAVIKNNGSNMSKKNTPMIIPGNNTFSSINQNNRSSLFMLNPQFDYNNRNSANFKNLQNLNCSDNLNKVGCKVNFMNVLKTNNNYGGYLIIKQPMHKDTDIVYNHDKNETQKRTINQTT